MHREAPRRDDPTGEPRAGRRVVIAGGGTMGHVAIALAIAHAYRRLVADADVLLLTQRDPVAGRRIAREGFASVTIPAAPYAKQGLRGRLVATVTLVSGIRQSRRILRRHRADLLIGAGAYPSVAPILAARSLRIPIVLHEANIVPGLANRLGARMADGMTLGWDETRAMVPGVRTHVCGNPVMPAIEALASLRTVSLAEDRHRRVLVVGGSGGSSFLNTRGAPLLARIAAEGIPVEAWHLTGHAGAVESTQAAYRACGVRARVEPFADDPTDVYRWADFAVSSAGAVTLAELAMAGLPALVVPAGHVSEDHQSPNAHAYARSSGSLCATEGEWDEGVLATKIAAILKDEQAYRASRERALSCARPHAARGIVEFCEAVLAGRTIGA
jgi:UDP-N-acetylglucosamine--N-acetylmuramyl-(pentapeptide) pyrophosphoryl-undecaprenol N-acetylglucosamine transferase